MQLKRVLGKVKDISFGVIAAPILIIIMMLISIFDQRAFKEERNRKKEQDKI
jgi:Na+-transporting methylmalonyl-CoA/oxaloacetate decarboxylase gamma subunit